MYWPAERQANAFSCGYMIHASFQTASFALKRQVVDWKFILNPRLRKVDKITILDEKFQRNRIKPMDNYRKEEEMKNGVCFPEQFFKSLAK